MKQFFQETIHVFNNLSGVEKAGFSFFTLCTLFFAFAVGAVLFLTTKDSFKKVRQFLFR